MVKDGGNEWWRGVPTGVVIAGGVGISAALWWRAAQRNEEEDNVGKGQANRDWSRIAKTTQWMKAFVQRDDDRHRDGVHKCASNGSGEEGTETDLLRDRLLTLTFKREEMDAKVKALESALQKSHMQNKGLRDTVEQLEWQIRASPQDTGAADVKYARDAHLVVMAQRAAACERGEISHEVLVKTMITSAYQLLHADRVSVFVVDEVRQELWLAVSDDAAGLRVPIGKGVAGTVARTKNVLNIPDCQTSALFDRHVDRLTGYATKTLVCVPIMATGSRPVAVCQALNKTINGTIVPFDETDAETLQMLGKELGMALRKRGLEVAFDRVIDRAEGADDDFGLSSLLALYTKPAWRHRRAIFERSRGGSESGGSQLEEMSRGGRSSPSSPRMKGSAKLSGSSRRKSSATSGDLSSWMREVVDNTGSLALGLDFEFDAFAKSEKELLLYIVDIYKASGLSDAFSINDSKLQRFAEAVQQSYEKHPFHNFYHGFSVMQVAYVILRDTSASEYLTALDTLAVITAALCHDLAHPGVSNDYLINTASPLALIYNDVSVLENHHARTTFELLQDPTRNILSELSPEEYAQVRRVMISGILHTDMRHHIASCERLRQVADKVASGAIEHPFDPDKEADRQFLVDSVIHAADLSGQALQPDLARQWGERVLEEFKNQAAREAANKLPLTPFMQGLEDGYKRAKTQHTFVSYVLIPLWTAMADIFPELQVLSDNVKVNQSLYEDEMLEHQKQADSSLAGAGSRDAEKRTQSTAPAHSGGDAAAGANATPTDPPHRSQSFQQPRRPAPTHLSSASHHLPPPPSPPPSNSRDGASSTPT